MAIPTMGRAAGLLALAALLGGCAGGAGDSTSGGSGGGAGGEGAPAAQRVAYSCAEERSFRARFGEDTVQIALDRERFELPRVDSPYGAMYRGRVAQLGGQVMLVTRGMKARLETPGLHYEGCDGTPAGEA